MPRKKALHATILVTGLLGILFYVFGILRGAEKATTINETSTSMNYHTNIVEETRENENFRKVLFTGKKSQLVVMSISKGGEVGEETHRFTEQTLFFLSGTGEAELNGKKFAVVAGDVVVVVPGAKHNFRNTGTEPLKLYTVYAPANHIDGRIHTTKADADADAADEAVGSKYQSPI
ncbi:MAG: cupin domain-containing protein [bacterium]|nr:cupin domain-containing protein [bacterium]